MAIKPAPKRLETTEVKIEPAASLLPSNKKEVVEDQTVESKNMSESRITEIINAGGTPPIAKSDKVKKRGGGPIKNINIKFLAEEGEMIDRLRDARPKIRNKKITISLHDWFIEAMQEKINREKKQYNL